jgi:DNA-directed RNA polymerase subunit RPC12/RpoP
MRKAPKEMVCGQCGKIFYVRSFTPEAPCPRCRKKHEVRTGKPTPFGKIKYWKGLELIEIPAHLYEAFKNDPQEFGYEIGLNAIPLHINPYDVACKADVTISCKLYNEGKRLGEYERRKRHE